MTTHIDTLKEWWSEAEEGVIEKGDTVINWFGGETTVYVAAERARRQNPHTRILARAPKPTPAWHNAVAIIAHIGGNELPRVLVARIDGAFVDGMTGHAYAADRLRDVTPLIEAKVTDEMVDRVREYKDFTGRRYFASREGARHLLAIALGLETE